MQEREGERSRSLRRQCWRVTNWVANNCAVRRVMGTGADGQAVGSAGVLCAVTGKKQNFHFISCAAFLMRPANVCEYVCAHRGAYKMASRVYFKTRTPTKVHTNNHTHTHILLCTHILRSFCMYCRARRRSVPFLSFIAILVAP